MKKAKKPEKGKSKSAKPSSKIISRPLGIISSGSNIYDPAFHPRDFVAHCREGNTKTYVAASWGVSLSTVDNWVRKYPEFGQAFSIGKTAYQAFMHDFSKRAYTGQSFIPKNSFGFFVLHAKNTMGWSDFGRDEFGIVDDEAPVWDTEDGPLTATNKVAK